MNAIFRILRFRLGSEPMDAWLSRWGCALGGITLSGMAASALWQHAESRLEFLLGVVAAVVSCLLLFLLGALARQVHLNVEEGKAVWRSRQGELLSHGAGLVILGFSGWALVSASLGIAGMVTGALLILGGYVAVLCLGCWSTLVSSRRNSVEV